MRFTSKISLATHIPLQRTFYDILPNQWTVFEMGRDVVDHGGCCRSRSGVDTATPTKHASTCATLSGCTAALMPCFLVHLHVYINIRKSTCIVVLKYICLPTCYRELIVDAHQAIHA